MKSLDFKYVSASNFLCFGPEGIELNLDKFGNVVLVRGDNLDVTEEEERIASNGVGKSSIPEIIVYTLFGKTIKQPKKLSHADVINNKVGKGLRTEVRWGDFRVVRTRKPDSLRIWESAEEIWTDDTELTLGGMPATQTLIEEKIGLNYDTFVNVMIFTDNNAGSFLECDTPTKRKIVENLLSLEKYRKYNETAKEFHKQFKSQISNLNNEHDNLLYQLQKCKDRVTQIEEQKTTWQAEKKAELKSLILQAKETKKQLESTDEGAAVARYQEAQDRIAELVQQISELETKKIKLDEMLEAARTKVQTGRNQELEHVAVSREFSSKVRSLQSEVENWESQIEDLEGKNNTKCNVCFGEVSEENYGPYVNSLRDKIIQNNEKIKRTQRLIDKEQEKLSAVKSKIDELNKAIKTATENSKKINTHIENLQKEVKELNKVEKPTNKDVDNVILEKTFENLRKQILDKEKEISSPSPYEKILKSAGKEVKEKEIEVENKKKEVALAEKELPYYDFWVKAFGDNGIRKFVIDGIIPSLNSRIAYWLQYLIDGKIKLEFNNQLEERIDRNPSDGDPFVYHAMSGGERRRLNLAASQAFAHVMMLNSGACPSLVFLDEVTTNIDPIGVIGVYNMIMELAKERMVFVTTHDQGLLDMLEGCETIYLEKKDGFTRIK